MLCWKVNKLHASLMNCFISSRIGSHSPIFIFVLTMDVKEAFKIFSSILNLKFGGFKLTFGRVEVRRREGGKLLGTWMDALCSPLNLGSNFVPSFLWQLEGSKISKTSSSFCVEDDCPWRTPNLHLNFFVWMFCANVSPIIEELFLDANFGTTTTSPTTSSNMKPRSNCSLKGLSSNGVFNFGQSRYHPHCERWWESQSLTISLV